MIRNAIFLTTILLCGIGWELLHRLQFLAPYKNTLVRECGVGIAVFFAALGLNLFAGLLAIHRMFLLKDTGRKLSHVDKQLEAEGVDILPKFQRELP